MEEYNKLAVWKEYENISMHFNTLLIQLRIRALGGIGIIVAIIGFVSKSGTSGEIQWGLLGGSFLILSFVWLAIFLLDYYYYNKLLLGAVSSTTKLESCEEKTPKINFSTDVKLFIEGKGQSFSNLWPIKAFYFIVLTLLFLSSLYSFGRAFCAT